MKSKTKTILIFAAILAAVFLIALLDGGALQSAADEEEEGTLIGAFVSEEDLNIDDLEVTATGKIQWKRGRLYAERTEEGWRFPDLPDGGGIFSVLPMESEDANGETENPLLNSDFPEIVYIGSLGKADGRSNVNRENGVSTVEASLSGEVYSCVGDTVFHFYPIYQLPDGRVYLTRGSSFSTSGDRDGESTTFTLSSDRTVTVGGSSERAKTEVKITAVVRPTPTKFTVAHMDENDQLLKLEEFAPDALPESITAAPGAAYLIGTSYGQGWDGETAEYSICNCDGRIQPPLDTFAYQDGKLKAVSIWVNWKEGAA